MRLIPPNKRDIADIAVAIESFDKAFGSVDALGTYRPSLDGLSLWMMINVPSETMAALWQHVGIATGPDSSYMDMLNADKHTIYIKAVKAKRNFFGRERWAGNISLLFDKMKLPIGSVGGDTQSEMWQHLRAFMNFEAGVFDSTISALEGNTNRMLGRMT